MSQQDDLPDLPYLYIPEPCLFPTWIPELDNMQYTKISMPGLEDKYFPLTIYNWLTRHYNIVLTDIPHGLYDFYHTSMHNMGIRYISTTFIGSKIVEWHFENNPKSPFVMLRRYFMDDSRQILLEKRKSGPLNLGVELGATSMWSQETVGKIIDFPEQLTSHYAAG